MRHGRSRVFDGLGRGSVVALVAVAAISALQLAWLCEWPGHGVDDSLITQVYGRNLSQGSGWVYHPKGERVEGTTSFLYTLIWAAAFHTPAPRAVMHGLGFVLCLLALRLAQSASERLARDRGGGRRGVAASWWFAILAAAFPPLVTWSTITLMDSTLWLALTMAAAWMLVPGGPLGSSPRARVAVATLAALMPLTRPEGFVVAPAWIGLVSLRPGTGLRRLDGRLAMPAAIAFASTVAGLTLWRWLYFGHPLPNTYYAKVSPSLVHNVREGSAYLVHTLLDSPVAASALALALLATMWPRGQDAVGEGSRGRRAEARLALMVVLLVGTTVVEGGDHFPQGRFLVAPLSMALVIAAAALARVTPAALSSRVSGAGAVALLLLLTVGTTIVARAAQEKRDPIALEFIVGRCGLEFGRALSRVTAGLDARPSWGVFAAGGTAFAYEGPVIDLLGLNNVEMAHAPGRRRGHRNHEAFDRSVFYRQAPDIVQESVFTECVNRPRRAFRRALIRSYTDGVQDEAEFRRRYVPMVVRLAPGDRGGRAERTSDELGTCVEGMALYAKRDLSVALAGAGAEAAHIAVRGATRGD